MYELAANTVKIGNSIACYFQALMVLYELKIFLDFILIINVLCKFFRETFNGFAGTPIHHILK